MLALRPVIDALVALAATLVVVTFCVNPASVARSIAKPASFAELSDQVRLICVEPAAEAARPN